MAERDKDSYREKEARADRLIALMEADPQAFQQLLAKIGQKMLIPHSDGQREVLTSDKRFMVLCAGRRWGKSQVGAARALRMARKPGQIIWWAAPTYKNVKHGYRAVIEQMPDGLLSKPAPPDSVFDAGRAVILQFKNGSRIQFFSAERPEGILGGSCDYLILDEAATMPEHVWTTYLRATLADRQGGALFISTPRGRNWFYYLWARGQSQDPKDAEWESWRFPSFTNPTIPASEWDEAKQDMPSVEYEQEILADFISEAAAVFRFPKAVDSEGKPIEDAVSPAISPLVKPAGHVIVGLDLAKHSDWTVILGLNSHDGRPCYHDRFQQVSWPMQRQRIYDAVADIEMDASGVTIMVDSGGPGDVIYDDLEEEGYDVVPINFTTYKEKMVKLLSSDLERGRAYVFEDAVMEFEHYSYSITGSGRWKYEALRGHDDEVSAALLAHWGRIHEGVPNIQTLTSESTPAGSVDGWTRTQSDPWADEYMVDESQIHDTGRPTTRTVEVRPPSVNDLLVNANVWS